MSSYVQILRPDMEHWLDGLVGRFDQIQGWSRVDGTVGVYQLPLTEHVCVTIGSSQARNGKAKGRGQASVDIRLSSLHNGRTLNRKATGQKRFHRTTRWRDNWAKGVKRLIEAHDRSPDFYARIAQEEPEGQRKPEPRRDIRLRYSTVDHVSKARTFHTLEAAQAWSVKWLDKCPEVSESFGYAVSFDGIAKITILGGCSPRELWPHFAEAMEQAEQQAAECDSEAVAADDASELQDSLDGEALRERAEAFPEPQREPPAPQRKDPAAELLAEADRLRQEGLRRLEAMRGRQQPSWPDAAELAAEEQAETDRNRAVAEQIDAEPHPEPEPAPAPSPQRDVSMYGIQARIEGELSYVAVLSTWDAAQASLRRAAQAKLPAAKLVRIRDAATLDMARLQARRYAEIRRAEAREGFAVSALVEGTRRVLRVLDTYEEADEIAKQAAGSGNWPSVRVRRLTGADLLRAERESMV